MNTVQPLIMRALISPANQTRGSLQIRDLCFKLSSLPRETTVQIWQPANQKEHTTEQNAGREIEQLDHRTLESFNKQNHEQHQALLIQSGNKSRLYTRLSFNLLSQLIDANPSTSMLPLGMLRQIKDSPSFDRHMLRQALARINENNQTAKPTLIRISSTSLRDSEHFQKLLQELDGRPSEDLAQLILELEAVSLLSGTGYCRQEVKHLQEMGVAIAIDDSAINAPPIKAIFSLGPRYLMVGPGFSDRSRDSDAETVVEFLLGYCRYKHCTLVMTEVNDADTLKYWNSRGVAAFEGEQAQRLAA
jgi:EAL domain-containing protein (putative c-di-GMP-specific phosphodiesterase class I)